MVLDIVVSVLPIDRRVDLSSVPLFTTTPDTWMDAARPSEDDRCLPGTLAMSA